MHKSFIFPLSFIIFLTTFSACSNEELQWQKIDRQAVGDAENLSADAHQYYLQCYPLNQQSKRECVQQLNNQYITNTVYQSNPQYQMSFQYRAEKLGFLKFLKEHNLPCSGIDHGPKFIAAENAYQVICTCGNSYSMQFDYNSKQWHLRK